MGKEKNIKSVAPVPPKGEKETEKKKKKAIPRRDPNRQPSTKIFDIIGDIIKTPYIIRGGNAKGGRIGLKDGSKGCGKAIAGKGKAYGKNS